MPKPTPMSPCRSALCLSTALLVIAAPTYAQKTATKFPGRGWHKVTQYSGNRRSPISCSAGPAPHIHDHLAKASDKRNPYYRRAPDGTIRHLTRINGDNIKEAVGGRPGESQVNLGATLTSEHRH